MSQFKLNLLMAEQILFKNLNKNHAPKFLIEEIEEQINFWNKNRIISRMNWSINQWLDWYNSDL